MPACVYMRSNACMCIPSIDAFVISLYVHVCICFVCVVCVCVRVRVSECVVCVCDVLTAEREVRAAAAANRRKDLLPTKCLRSFTTGMPQATGAYI